jgi:hypothetical protein
LLKSSAFVNRDLLGDWNGVSSPDNEDGVADGTPIITSRFFKKEVIHVDYA